jgi:hypothetical protein
MTYFVPSGAAVDVDQLRTNADTLTGSITGVFSQEGSLYYRVESPLIGEVFGFLSDVSLVDYGDGNGIIQNVTQINGIQVYQVARDSTGHYSINASSGTADTELDAVLSAQFPTYVNNSFYSKFTMGPGQSSADYLPEFYISVTGNGDLFDAVFGSSGLNAPDDGRFLLTRGSISGKRDAAWGNWLDTVGADQTGGPPEGGAPELTLPSNLEKWMLPARMDAERARERLDDITFELDSLRERLNDLNDQTTQEIVLLALKGTALLGTYAGLVVSAYSPTGALATLYESLSFASSANDAIQGIADIFREGVSIEQLDKANQSLAKFFVDGEIYSGKYASFLSNLSIAQDTLEFISDAQNYSQSLDVIKQNIISVKDRIHQLEHTQDELIQFINQSPQLSPQSYSIQAVQTDLIHVDGDADTLALSYGHNHAILEAGSVLYLPDNPDGGTAVALLGDYQVLFVGAGSSVVDGTHSKHEIVVVPGDIGEFSSSVLAEAGAVFERAGIQSVIIDVDRIHFLDRALALDLDGNAGQAYRLYQAAFDRTPDAEGLGYWIVSLDMGQGDLTWVAHNFILSDEFRAMYGDPSTVTNDAFLSLIYQNVLNREPDGAGYKYWIDSLNEGFAREKVLASFSESVENQQNVAADISHGVEFVPWFA